MTNDLTALSEAYTKSPNAVSLTLLGHALVDEYRAGRLVPNAQLTEATARAEAADARNKVLEEALRVIRSEAQRENGSWVHIKRCIAVQSAQALGGKHER
jgi:hypothetical protein